MSKKKKTILIIVSIICVWLLVGIVDFSLVHNYHKPIFSLLIKPEYQDGGSGHYVGLGYSFDIENIAKEKCKVNYEYVKSEISGENTKWVVEFYEDNAMLPAQTIILEKDGTIIENWYSE